MSFIQINLSDVKEAVAAPEDIYSLAIVDVEGYIKEETKNYVLRCRIAFVDHQGEYNNINHFMSMPGENDDADKAEMKKLFIKRFLTVIGIQYEQSEGFEQDDLMGTNFTCAVQQDEPTDDGTVYNSLILPRLELEEAA